MTLVAAPLGIDALGDRVDVIKFSVTASSSYVTGGDTLDLTPLQQVGILRVPFLVLLEGQAGFVYKWVPGTTIANGKMKVFVATTGGTNLPLAEHTAVSYVAGVTGDTIIGKALVSTRL